MPPRAGAVTARRAPREPCRTARRVRPWRFSSAVFAHQQIQVLTLLIGEFQEDLLAFGILKPLTGFLKKR